MKSKSSWSPLIWINVALVICLAGYGHCFKIPLRTDIFLDQPSTSATVVLIRPKNTSTTASSSTSSSILAAISSTTTVTVTSTLHSTLSTQVSSTHPASSSSSAVLRDQRPTVDEKTNDVVKAKKLSRVSRIDDQLADEKTERGASRQQKHAVQQFDANEDKISKSSPNSLIESTERSTAMTSRSRRPGWRLRKKQRQMSEIRERMKNNDIVKRPGQIDDPEEEGSESEGTSFEEMEPTSRPRGKKNQRRLNKGKKTTELRIRHARKKMGTEVNEGIRRRRKNLTTETVVLTTETPRKVKRKREINKMRIDRPRNVEEDLGDDTSPEPEDVLEEDDYDDFEDYDEDYDEYDDEVTKPSVISSRAKTNVLPEVKTKPKTKIAVDNDDEYDDESVDDEDDGNDFEDDEDGEDYDYDDGKDISTTEHGDGSDVTYSATNQKPRFSDTRQRSADVTAGSTNGRAASTITDSDVEDPRDGVGGKSMNEFLAARLRDALPATLSALGSCDLEDLKLVVQCGERMMSVCAGSPDHEKLKVLFENSDGGALLDSNTTVAYGLLRPLPSGRRWLITDRPTRGILSTAWEPGLTDVPVLRLQSGMRMCRFLVNCTRSLGPDEAWHRLPRTADLSPCTRPPTLHARMLLTSGNGSEILPGTKISLGEKISLRVEAEADLTGTSLQWTETSAAKSFRSSSGTSSGTNLGTSSGTSTRTSDGSDEDEDEAKATRPTLDLHLSKCWVGNTEVDKASLVKDGCSVVDILTNFVEVTEEATIFLNMPPASGTNYNPSRWPILKKSYQQSAKENSSPRESGDSGAKTTSDLQILTRKVVQKAELVTFVLDLKDEKINISCTIEVCVGQCRSPPSCVKSSVNTKYPRPPVHSTTITLTTTIIPDTGISDTVTTTEPSTEQALSTPDDGDTISATDKEEVPAPKKRHPRSTVVETVQSGSRSNITKSDILLLESGVLHSKTREQSLLFAECVPWWVFLLSITILSMVYIVALFGCVYMTNQNTRDYIPVDFQATHTPVRSNFPDQSSARKRTPQACPDRYLY